MVKKVKLQIPDSAIKVKAYWFEEPSKEVVSEILQWIKEGNQSYLWWGHTHTKPPDNSEYEFIGEFIQPESYSKYPFNWYPCPCCHSNINWFKGSENRPGMIAWFPKEGVIRLIGYDCFTKQNPEFGRIAREKFRQKKKINAQINFIASNAYKIPRVLDAIAKNKPIAKAADRFHRLLHIGLKKLTLYGALNEITDGVLFINENYYQTKVDNNGQEYELDSIRSVVYARISGVSFLQKNFNKILPELEKASSELKQVQELLEVQNRTSSIENIDSTTLKKMVSDITRAITKVRASEKQLKMVQQFLGPITINTLNAWSRHSKKPVELFIDRNQNKFIIGSNEDCNLEIPISSALNESVAKTPDLAGRKTMKNVSLKSA